MPELKKTKTKKTKPRAKKAVKKPRAVLRPAKETPKKGVAKYFEAVGRRKTAVARVRLFTMWETRASSVAGAPLLGDKAFLVNQKSVEQYFPTLELQQITKSPLDKMKCLDKFKISVIVKGGGYHAQAEAVRHGLAQALVLFNPDFRKKLKKAGFLTRDPRMRERKKFGLKRARRAPQWQKR